MNARFIRMTFAGAALFLVCCADASACCWRWRVCRPRRCTYYYCYQAPVQPNYYPSANVSLVPLRELPKLPEAYFPSVEPQ
jgi:hypothetical protein